MISDNGPMPETPPQPDRAPEPAPWAWLASASECPPQGHWDELRGQLAAKPGQPPQNGQGLGLGLSPAWQAFAAAMDLAGSPHPASLNTRMANLQSQVRDNGITYNVYAASDAAQRPWSLDLFPLLLDPADWQGIEAGVVQRMRLLERIMADAYGPQHLVRTGQLPAALVQGHPAYLPGMQGVAPVGGRYLSLAAFDLARGPDGCWWLMSQRTQAPSGLGYLLENRQIVSRLFPQAFESFPVQQLAHTYRCLVDGMKARSPAGASAHIALLTPGPYNETYFEHAYLARHLGLSLVQGQDLTVRDEKLYLKTLQGLQPVHGLLKRVDDAWLDPLELRADSTLGVAGLLQVVRQGHLLVANTPGSGFLESNALLGFMPALARELLGEALQLPAIPSWWCGEAAAWQDVLPRMRHCVIKPTYPDHTDRQSFEPVLGHTLSPRELDEWAGRIARDPDAHTLQSFLPLSHQPVWQTGADGQAGIQTRPVVLRVFAVADGRDGWQVLPGGLARLGSRSGMASMQRGGSSADVWVPSTGQPPAAGPSLPAGPAARRERLVTSRAGENLFWMGRYTERTENTLRLVRLGLEVLGSENQRLPCLLDAITQLAQRHGLVRAGVPGAAQAHRVFERALIAGLWDREMATSVGFNLRAVCLAAAAVRERLSPEHWRLLEQAQARFFQPTGGSDLAHLTALPESLAVQSLLADTSQMLAALTGAQTDRMSRDDGWRLLSMGRHIERLEFLCGALGEALRHGLLAEQAGFDAVLDLFDSTISFHAQYQQSRTPHALMELLVTDSDNPRSLGWVAQTLRARLRRMGHLAEGATLSMADRIPDLVGLRPEVLGPSAGSAPGPGLDWPLMQTLADCQAAAREVSDQLCALFFTHSGQARYSVHA